MNGQFNQEQWTNLLITSLQSELTSSHYNLITCSVQLHEQESTWFIELPSRMSVYSTSCRSWPAWHRRTLHSHNSTGRAFRKHGWIVGFKIQTNCTNYYCQRSKRKAPVSISGERESHRSLFSIFRGLFFNTVNLPDLLITCKLIKKHNHLYSSLNHYSYSMRSVKLSFCLKDFENTGLNSPFLFQLVMINETLHTRITTQEPRLLHFSSCTLRCLKLVSNVISLSLYLICWIQFHLQGFCRPKGDSPWFDSEAPGPLMKAAPHSGSSPPCGLAWRNGLINEKHNANCEALGYETFHFCTAWICKWVAVASVEDSCQKKSRILHMFGWYFGRVPSRSGPAWDGAWWRQAEPLDGQSRVLHMYIHWNYRPCLTISWFHYLQWDDKRTFGIIACNYWIARQPLAFCLFPGFKLPCNPPPPPHPPHPVSNRSMRDNYL